MSDVNQPAGSDSPPVETDRLTGGKPDPLIDVDVDLPEGGAVDRMTEGVRRRRLRRGGGANVRPALGSGACQQQGRSERGGEPAPDAGGREQRPSGDHDVTPYVTAPSEARSHARR